MESGGLIPTTTFVEYIGLSNKFVEQPYIYKMCITREGI